MQFAIRFGAAGRLQRWNLNHELGRLSTNLLTSALILHLTDHKVRSTRRCILMTGMIRIKCCILMTMNRRLSTEVRRFPPK
jgi:hypothetical protein